MSTGSASAEQAEPPGSVSTALVVLETEEERLAAQYEWGRKATQWLRENKGGPVKKNSCTVEELLTAMQRYISPELKALNREKLLAVVINNSTHLSMDVPEGGGAEVFQASIPRSDGGNEYRERRRHHRHTH